jgi:ferritin-like protein
MSFDLKILKKKLVISNGKLAIVQNTEKLVQDIFKILITPVGGNPLFSWYGSYLGFQSIGTANEDPAQLQVIARTQIENALNKLKSLQDMQINSYQNVSSSEQIAGFKSINVGNDLNDPRRYIVNVVVIAKDLKQVPITFNVKLV